MDATLNRWGAIESERCNQLVKALHERALMDLEHENWYALESATGECTHQ